MMDQLGSEEGVTHCLPWMYMNGLLVPLIMLCSRRHLSLLHERDCILEPWTVHMTQGQFMGGGELC